MTQGRAETAAEEDGVPQWVVDDTVMLMCGICLVAASFLVMRWRRATAWTAMVGGGAGKGGDAATGKKMSPSRLSMHKERQDPPPATPSELVLKVGNSISCTPALPALPALPASFPLVGTGDAIACAVPSRAMPMRLGPAQCQHACF